MMQYIQQIMENIPHLGTLRSFIIFPDTNPRQLCPIRLSRTDVVQRELSKCRFNSFGLGKTRVREQPGEIRRVLFQDG